MKNNKTHRTTIDFTVITDDNRLTYRQLQQLCRRGRELGYIDKGFNLNQDREILERVAAAICLRMALAEQQ